MADLTMETLLDAIVAFLTADIGTGSIATGTILEQGIKEDPDQFGAEEIKWISIDDSGERTEEVEGTEATLETQHRIYSFLVEIGSKSYVDLKTAMRNTFSLYNQVKASFENIDNKPANDVSLTFGRTVTPIAFEGPDDQYFIRGRQVIVEYKQLEDIYQEF